MSDTSTHYEVIVGNVGRVYDGDDSAEARRTFDDYVTASKSPHGRASGEEVNLIENDDIIDTHYPPNHVPGED